VPPRAAGRWPRHLECARDALRVARGEARSRLRIVAREACVERLADPVSAASALSRARIPGAGGGDGASPARAASGRAGATDQHRRASRAWIAAHASRATRAVPANGARGRPGVHSASNR
jgi:hypothetical protein